MRPSLGVHAASRRRSAPNWDYIIGLNASDIQALPTSGTGAWGQNLATAFNNMKAKADSTITPEHDNINSSQAGLAFGAALQYVRLKDSDPTTADTYRNKVITALDTIAGDAAQATPSTGWLVGTIDHQVVTRQTAGWMLAADLIDYRSADLLAYADKIRDKTLSNLPTAAWSTMRKYACSFAGNHGTLAKASFMACTLYRGDPLPSWVIPSIYCFWGDLSKGFGTKAVENTDMTGLDAYSCDGATAVAAEQTWGLDYSDNGWTPVNSVPGDATKDNALIVEVARETSNTYVNYSVDGNGHPNWGDDYVGTSAGAGANYFFTNMWGILVATLLAEKNGAPDIWTNASNGPLRCWQYVWSYQDKWPSASSPFHFSLGHWVDSLMEQRYPGQLDRSYGSVAACTTSYGFDFTDWLML